MCLWQVHCLPTDRYHVLSYQCGIYRVGQKNWHHFLHALCQILTDFQNSFSFRIREKFVITMSL